ncbi:hypothetical protein P7F60_06230 [Rhizobium sp. YJ-22]|uniref:hypothetical protein n=1 Tax=Rhizobium sp. YJ-22 TaxID=3037556 RepID=UPI0024124D99|nr:hypothetical protein [Rhizobium sp. YJ-22]MDG3575973.1 hypothetical protein [Rhizobium sp. YJ-22]
MSGLLVSGQPPATRAIAEANDSFGRLAEALDLVPQIGRTVMPDGWMPWLLRNAGLQAMMPYVDWATLWDKGPAWLTLRGTPAASVEALSWVGWSIRFEDGEIGSALYDRYHIHLDRVPWRAELERLIAVELFAKSSDSIFFRLVHGYDIRPVRGGMSRFGGAIFGRFSGIDVRPDWPRLSFRATGVMHWPASTKVSAAETLTVAAWASLRGDIIYGNSRFCSRPKAGPVFAMELSDSLSLTGALADHRAIDAALPVAGVVGGRTRFAGRQAVFVPYRLLSGETPMLASYRFGQRLRPAEIERVLRIPDPIDLAALVDAGATVDLREQLLDRAAVTVAPSILAADTPDGPAHVGTIATLDNAPWSGLPWGDDALGSSPRVQATEETT